MPTGFEFYVVTRSYPSRLFLFTFAFGYKGCYDHRQYTYGDQAETVTKRILCEEEGYLLPSTCTENTHHWRSLTFALQYRVSSVVYGYKC